MSEVFFNINYFQNDNDYFYHILQYVNLNNMLFILSIHRSMVYLFHRIYCLLQNNTSETFMINHVV